MQKDKGYYNDFFKRFGADIHDDPVRFMVISQLCEGFVADFGCGTGTLSKYYNGRYDGYDISEEAIKIAKWGRRKDADFIEYDIVTHHIEAEKKYDTIVVAELLEHIENDEVLIKNIKNNLVENGKIIVSVPNGDRVPDESHCRQFTVPELRQKFKELGRVRFHNYIGFEKRILMTVEAGKENKNDVALAIIAKNEGLGLENAILSFIDYADKIVISVDTESYDNTLDIAKRYADVVKLHEWQGSFADVRNYVQENIGTRWVFHLDGHEFVKQVKNLDYYMDIDVDALNIKIILENGFEFMFPRLVKSEVRWKNAVHNAPEIKSQSDYSNLIICHDRTHKQAKEAVEIRDKQRMVMVREIMKYEIKVNKKSPRPYFYLGQQMFSEKKFRKAIKYYKKYLKYSPHNGEKWLVNYDKAMAHIFLGHYLRAIWATRDADKEVPDRWETAKLRGVIFGMAGKYEKAAGELVDSFKVNEGKYAYMPVQRDDAQTWDYIGYCLMQAGKIELARVAWKRAIKLEKEKPPGAVNNRRIEILSNLL